MTMSKQKELSDNLIKHINQEVVVYHQKRKKLQKLNNYVLPNTFGEMLKKTGYKHALKINASKEPSQYQLAKKLASLFWIKAIKTDKCNIYFKKTKLGKLIQDKLLSHVNYSHVPWTLFELIIPISILLFGVPLGVFLQSPIVVGLCCFLSLSMEIFSMVLDSTSKKIYKNKKLSVYKCITVLKNHMNLKDIKYEYKLLQKYSVKKK